MLLDEYVLGLGRCEAESLSVDDVEEFLATQVGEVSLQYVQMQRNVLDQAYKWAARNRLLTWNPAALASLPHTARSDHGQVLTADQAANLLESTRGNRWHALWATMLGAGLRPGEALALTWPCLDLDTDPGVVHVRHYLRTGTDGPFLGEPKTARSNCSLDLPHFTTEALRELKSLRQSFVWVCGQGWCSTPTPTNQSGYPTHAEPSGVLVLMLGYRGCVCMTCVAPQEACWSTLVCI